MIDIRDFGASGNGTTDDSDFILRAISVAKENGGECIWFPRGKYVISRPILLDSHRLCLRGEGAASVLVLSSSEATIQIGANTTKDDCTHCEISHMQLVRTSGDNGAHVVSAIKIERARFTTLSHLTILERETCVTVGVPGSTEGIPCQWVIIENCWMTGGPKLGIDFINGADYAVDKVHIEPGKRGIWMRGNSNGIFVTNTKIINGGAYDYGVVCEGSGFARHIISCNIENAREQQVYIRGATSRSRISNCWLGAGDTEAHRVGIFIDGGTDDGSPSDIWITDNRIGDQVGPGIIVRQANNVLIEGNAILANVNLGDLEASVEIEGAKNVTLSGNRVTSQSHAFGLRLRSRDAMEPENHIITNNNFVIEGANVQVAAIFNETSFAIGIESNNLG